VRADARAAAGAAVRADARAATGATVRADARAAAGAAVRDRLIRLIVMHGSWFSAAWSSGSCLVNCVAGLVIGSLW
jgi:hypothetical protein